MIVSGWPGIVPFVPVNSLGLDRTQRDAGTAAGAFRLVDDRPLGYSILQEYPESATGTGHRGRSIHLEALVDKGIEGFTHKLYILTVISPQS